MPKAKAKLSSATRHEAILEAALLLAEQYGFRSVRRDAIAAHAGVATGSVTYHYKSMAQLQDAVIKLAVKKENLTVLSQAMVEGHSMVKALPRLLKQRVAQLLVN